jgi:hypothetical protein
MGVVILYDDVSDDDCIDDQTECDGYYVERTESATEGAEDPKSGTVAAQKWTLLTVVFIGKDKMKWDRIKRCTHIFEAGGKIS